MKRNNYKYSNNQDVYQRGSNYKKESKYRGKNTNKIRDINDYFNFIENKSNQTSQNFPNDIGKKSDLNFEDGNNLKFYNVNKKDTKKKIRNGNEEKKDFNESSKEIKNVKKVFISYVQLKEIHNKDDNDIMQFFMKFKDLSKAFNNTKFTKDMIDLMVELLVKVSTINSGPAITTLNQIMVNTSFISLMKKRLEDIDFKQSDYLNFLYNVTVLSDKLIDKFSDDQKRIKYSELSEYAELLQDLIDNNDINEDNDKELALKISGKMKEIKDKERHKKLCK